MPLKHVGFELRGLAEIGRELRDLGREVRKSLAWLETANEDDYGEDRQRSAKAVADLKHLGEELERVVRGVMPELGRMA